MKPGIRGTGLRIRTTFLVLPLLLAACAEPPDEKDLVIATIRNIEAAAEDANHREFLQHVDPEFAGAQGFDRRALKAILLRQLNRYQRIRAQLGPIRVTVHDSQQPLRASAEFEALLLGGQGWLPESGELYRFSTGWRKDGREWRLLSANWSPVVD